MRALLCFSSTIPTHYYQSQKPSDKSDRCLMGIAASLCYSRDSIDSMPVIQWRAGIPPLSLGVLISLTGAFKTRKNAVHIGRWRIIDVNLDIDNFWPRHVNQLYFHSLLSVSIPPFPSNQWRISTVQISITCDNELG